MTSTTLTTIAFHICEPDGNVVFASNRKDEIAALDEWADSMEMQRYSDSIRQSVLEGEDPIVCRVEGVVHAIHTNYSVTVVPVYGEVTDVDVSVVIPDGCTGRVSESGERIVHDDVTCPLHEGPRLAFVQNPDGMFSDDVGGEFVIETDRSLDEGAAILTMTQTGLISTFMGFIFDGRRGYYVEVPKRLADAINTCIELATDQSEEDLEETLGLDADDLEQLGNYQDALRRLSAL
jgi:hypothetical protein